MEKLLQYLDDLDDLYGTIGLLAERLRALAWKTALLAMLAVIVTASVALALKEPPLGLATAILLFVFLLYREVTQPGPGARAHREPA